MIGDRNKPILYVERTFGEELIEQICLPSNDFQQLVNKFTFCTVTYRLNEIMRQKSSDRGISKRI